MKNYLKFSINSKMIALIFACFITQLCYAQKQSIVIISQLKSTANQDDQSIALYLKNKGYHVDIQDQSIQPSTIGHVDLVIISSSVASKNMQKGWRELKTPLLTWENDYLDDLAMTGKRINYDFGEVEKDRYLWLVNAPHPLSAGLTSGTLNVYKKQAAMSWGKPGLGATIIATIYGQPEKPAIWAYEKGATMDYESIAPEKRMMFFLNNETFNNLNEDGLKLFDATITWMLKK